MSRLRNLTPVLATLMLAGPVLHSADLATIGDTKLRIYGFLQIYGYEFFNAFQTPGSEASSLFYQDPANGGSSTILNTSNQPDKNFQFGIAPSRFGLASTTPSASSVKVAGMAAQPSPFSQRPGQAFTMTSRFFFFNANKPAKATQAITDSKFRDGANPANEAQNSNKPMAPAPTAALNVVN